MDKSIEAIAKLYELNTGLFHRVLGSANDQNQFSRPSGAGNSINWIAGHMAASRYMIANTMGIDDQCPWGEIYDYGAEIKEESAYPSIDEIRAKWDEISAKLKKALSDADSDLLNGPPPFEIPNWENNKRGSVNFLYMHESYHLGQLAYVSRLQGGDRPFG